MSVKAKEVRIGNYIKHNDEICEVFSISKEWLRVTKDRHIAISYDNLKPIELTEEILLKCGFVENDKWFYKEKFLLGYLTNDDNLQAEWKFGGVEGTWNLIDIKYLHQLQNIYFYLTTQELVVNF